LALDLKLRTETEGRVSLDDVMRACWEKWGETGEGMPEHGLEEASAEVSGLDLGAFFDAAVRGTGELALEQLLHDHGVDYCLRIANGRKDKGGKKVDAAKLPAVWLGANLAVRTGKAIFANLSNGGPAECAGVSPGDELIALDGIRANVSGSDTRIRRYRPGDKSELTVFRGDELLTLKLTWAEAPADTCYLQDDDAADSATIARRNNWLIAQ
jgi:predicted metalloprotease with PDZ domain